jgi:hypothetical protein
VRVPDAQLGVVGDRDDEQEGRVQVDVANLGPM